MWGEMVGAIPPLKGTGETVVPSIVPNRLLLPGITQGVLLGEVTGWANSEIHTVGRPP